MGKCWPGNGFLAGLDAFGRMVKSRPSRPIPAFDPFEDGPDPAVLFAADGAVLRANAAFKRVFRQQIGPGRAPWGRLTPPPFDTNNERRFDAPAPDGRLFEWREQILPEGGRFAQARDVSDRAAAARAKTVLFATLTHELRTPLNGILGMADLLSRAALTPTETAYLHAIARSGEHLLDLVTEILDFSSLESGRVTLEVAPFDPGKVAQEVVELLSPKAFEKGLEIMVALSADVPNKVLGDAGRVRQILFNLAGNAVKFTETGGIVIALARHKGALRFIVRDSGPGISDDKKAQIFEEFQQGDASHARRHGGTGLGLAIVRKLASVMGGAVSVSSRVGHGAAFIVDLPLLPEAPSAEDAAEPRPLEGLKIGVSAANPMLLDGLIAMVTGLGAAAHMVTRPAQAAGLHAVLVDGAGADLAALRAMNDRIILLAPQEARGKLAALDHGGGTPYLLKPVRVSSLTERLRLVTGMDRGQVLARPTITDERDAAIAPLGLRVLLAEDNPINALLVRTLLQRAGCSVVTVGDGEEALAALSRGDGFDLVFLDLRMPRLDGLSAARRIRQLPGALGRTPVVALTADASDGDRAAALAAGMDDFLTKPIDCHRLAAVAGRLCQRAKPATV
jgi:signal transduction histidine kinase/DNA-binding response OmpR family regulator